MSRTALCLLTALALAVGSLSLLVVRFGVLGGEVTLPVGPGTWKIVFVAQGFAERDGRVLTASPLEAGRQHILREECRSQEFTGETAEGEPTDRRLVAWTPRTPNTEGLFRLRAEYFVDVTTPRPTTEMKALHRKLYAPPLPGEYRHAEDDAVEAIDLLGRELTAGRHHSTEQADAIFRFVDQEIVGEPAITGVTVSAADCLRSGCGDSAARSRLLAALLRGRGIPARLVRGLMLTTGPERQVHTWVEAWLVDRWVAMCPTNHHFDSLPPTYLTFAFGDVPMVRGQKVREVSYAFLVEKLNTADGLDGPPPSLLHQMFAAVSLHALPLSEQKLVEFLLLLPVAALVVCVFRNVIGLNSFGTFAPALVGLAFRDLNSLPGILVFVSILLIGWLMRRALDRLHLLQVPRSALLLTLVVLLLTAAIVGANLWHLPATSYVALFPLVILSGMIERFWTLETEDGTWASFKTLLSTMFIAGCIALLVSMPWLVHLLFNCPETMGLVMAGQLLMGRYTGYRLTELYRFRDLSSPAELEGEVIAHSYVVPGEFGSGLRR